MKKKPDNDLSSGEKPKEGKNVTEGMSLLLLGMSQAESRLDAIEKNMEDIKHLLNAIIRIHGDTKELEEKFFKR